MKIEDYDSACDVISPADIESALRKRRDGGVNEFWLGRIAGGLPPGFASVGGSLGLDHEGHTIFSHGHAEEKCQIMNDEIVLFSDALKAAQEFAVSNAMPKCLRWDSLVAGE
jgi:hypothetical protein